VRVVVDTAACTGHGRCYVLVPELFEDDERGHSIVRGHGEITAAQRLQAERAVTACPERAIAIVD
jgi:ferredoxin